MRPSTEEAVRKEFMEIGDSLAAADPHQRMTAIHPMTQHGSVREYNAARWMTFGDYQQNYRDLHGRVLDSLRLNEPVVNSEYGYFLRDQSGDGVPDKDNSTSAAAMRHATWDIIMAGGYVVTGFGTTYFGGHRDPGPFDLDAKKNDVWERSSATCGACLCRPSGGSFDLMMICSPARRLAAARARNTARLCPRRRPFGAWPNRGNNTLFTLAASNRP